MVVLYPTPGPLLRFVGVCSVQKSLGGMPVVSINRLSVVCGFVSGIMTGALWAI